MVKIVYPKIFDKGDLDYLKRIKSDGPVLSVYLPNIESENIHTVWESYRHLEKEDVLFSGLDESEKEIILKQIEEISGYLHRLSEFDYFNTLVIFSRKGKFFNVYTIPELLEKDFKISEIPYIKPIEEIYKKNGLIFVALVDRTKTEFFSLNWDRFYKEYGFSKYDVPQKIKGMGESWKGLHEKKMLHHIEWHLHEHLKKSAQDLFKIWQREKFKKLIIGGHREIIKKFEKELHSYLKPLIIERFHAEPDMFMKEVKKEGKSTVDRYKLEF